MAFSSLNSCIHSIVIPASVP